MILINAQVMSTAITLFAEMVGSIKDEEPAAVRDPVLTDLAEQCTFFKRCVCACVRSAAALLCHAVTLSSVSPEAVILQLSFSSLPSHHCP